MKLVLFFSLLISGIAHAEFSGRLYSDQYFYTQKYLGRTLAQNSVSGWLEYDLHPENTWSLKILEQIDASYRNLPHPSEASATTRLREAYASYSNDGWDVRGGKQIIPWGKSDGINPTDYFTAKDYTLMTPDDEVRRQGAPGMNVSFTPLQGASPFTFQWVALAYYPQTHLLIPPLSLPSTLRFSKDAPTPTAFRSDTMEAGLKIAYAQAGYDFSISYFQGYSPFQEYLFDPHRALIYASNPKETAMGGDTSFTAGNYVFRLESAVHLPENGGENDPSFGIVEPSHWDTVIGAERSFWNDFRVQAQGTLRQHLSFRDPSEIKSSNPLLTQINQSVGRANALILNFQKQSNPGATIRLGYASDHSNWTADLSWVGYFASGQSFIFKPQVGYKPMDDVKFLIGADFYGGNPQTQLGSLKSQSVAFVEGKYQF